MQIILASHSPRRKELLIQIGLKFDIIPSQYYETDLFDTPEETVCQYSRRKAEEVAARVPQGALVIGADTMVAIGEQSLGKPENSAEAREMLHMLSGRGHRVMTGMTVINSTNGISQTVCEITDVYFKELSEQEIEAYIASGEPFGKAGAYAIQGLGALFVERIEGCYSNVVGLPIHRLSQMLSALGYPVLSLRHTSCQNG